LVTKNGGIEGNLDSIEFPIKGFVLIGVIGKLTGGVIGATGSECVEAAIVETDTGAVTPVTDKTGIRAYTPMTVDTLAPLTDA